MSLFVEFRVSGNFSRTRLAGDELLPGWKNWGFRKLYNKLHNELQTYWMNCDPKPLSGEY